MSIGVASVQQKKLLLRGAVYYREQRFDKENFRANWYQEFSSTA